MSTIGSRTASLARSPGPRRKPRTKTLGRPEGSSGLVTRAKLMESAAMLFAQGGFTGVTLADIAGAAGLTAPSIYNHFSSKDELFVEVVTRMYEEIAATYRDAIAGSGGWRDRLGRVLDAAALVYRGDGVLQRLGGLARQKIDQDPIRFGRIADAKRDVDQVFRDIVAQGIEDGELPPDFDAVLAGDLLASMVMIGIASIMTPERRSRQDLNRIVAAFKALFL